MGQGMSESASSTTDTRKEPKWIDVAVRWLVDISLALHFVAAAGWWWFSPKGFPVATSPFWTNTALPLATMGLALAGIVALHFRHNALSASAVLCLSVAWMSAAVSGRIEFPISLAEVWTLFLMAGCVGGLLFLLLARGERRSELRSGYLLCVGKCLSPHRHCRGRRIMRPQLSVRSRPRRRAACASVEVRNTIREPNSSKPDWETCS
jgi:hypothetical protein